MNRHHPTVTPETSPSLQGITPAIVGRGHATPIDYPTLARSQTTPVSGKCIFKLPKYIAMIRFTGIRYTGIRYTCIISIVANEVAKIDWRMPSKTPVKRGTPKVLFASDSPSEKRHQPNQP